MIQPAFPRLVQLQERIRSLFYSYGLFCATHQFSTMLFAIGSFLFVIYPLKDTPVLGNTSQFYETPLQSYKVPAKTDNNAASPGWYSGPPVGYVQQIVVRATIAPSHTRTLQLSDSYRAPLNTAFNILEKISQIQVESGDHGKYTMSDVCLRIAEPHSSIRGRKLLPQFDCLLLSPANLWQNQRSVFEADKEIVHTVQSSAQYTFEASPHMREFLFGVPWLETGLSKFFIRNGKRTVQYALTIVYKTYNATYIDQLNRHLLSLYPLSSVNVNSSSTITHVSYRENNVSYLADYTPLIAAYIILFLYIYFSVQKIEMVKSKWGLAFSAVVTVVASLLMSISICAVFGVTSSVNNGEMFPYLVIIVGLENVLVVTRSVVSTPLNLEVKFRIAEGLRKEGWYITKHLLTELIILIVGFLTFVPAIQEFCLFAAIGLLVDFYLQMVFFATVLSIDIRRLELSDLERGHTYLHVQSKNSSGLPSSSTATTSPTHPGKNDTFIVASLFHIPKRIKIMNFVAQFRVVQRLIMVCTVIWITVVLYKTGIISGLVSQLSQVYRQSGQDKYFNFDVNDTRLPDTVRQTLNDPLLRPAAARVIHQEVNSVENWRRLSFLHWPAVFSLYNKSVVGKYVSFLPSIRLSVVIPPEQVLRSANPSALFYERDVTSSSEEREFADQTEQGSANDSVFSWIQSKAVFLQALTGTEKVLLGAAVLTVLMLLVWLLSYLYSIMCRRDYAKWRKSAGRYGLATRLRRYAEILNDETSLYMDGLRQPIECLVCSSDVIICSDLAGDICSWNSNTGETISEIDRSSHSVSNINVDDDSKLQQQTGSEYRCNEYTRCNLAVHSSDVTAFDLAPFVSTHFTTMEKRSFTDCLRDIELERANQTSMMTSAHRDLLSEQRVQPLSAAANGAASSYYLAPNIWCLDANDGMVVAGCSDGSIELWDSFTGLLKHRHRTPHRDSGIASIKCFANRVLAGHTDGYLDFIEIGYIPLLTSSQAEGGAPTTQYKGHRRIRSLGKAVSWREMDIQCSTLCSIKAHQSSIGLLAVASGRCLTACEDKIIHVYRSDDANLLYTLRGHDDTIILLQADEQTATAQTASEDGVIRLWDLLTGACIHKLTGLIGPVLSIQVSSNYIIASSLESLICIWDKSSGRMVHSIHKNNCSYTGAIAVLADSLLVSGGRDTLYFWDLDSGELVYSITLPTTNCMDGINKLTVMNSCSLVAAVGSQIHLIKFQKIRDRKI